MLITGGRVQVPPRAPCKDDYFDTMGIGVIVPTFCLKPPKIAEFLILLRKEPSLTGEISGTVMALFCFLGKNPGWSTVDLWGFVVLCGLSLEYRAEDMGLSTN